jgi:hypothetical protein
MWAVIVLVMEAVRTSETSVNFNVTTRRYIPENSKLHIRCLENLKSHMLRLSSSKNGMLFYVSSFREPG